MAISNVEFVLNCKIERAWNTVVSLENYTWRTDLQKIKVLEERKFVEYTKDGYMTSFTITVFEPFKRYEFDIENENIQGHWLGLFSEDNGKTILNFTENIIAKKWFLKPFLSKYLKKQQQRYIKDLTNAIEPSL